MEVALAPVAQVALAPVALAALAPVALAAPGPAVAALGSTGHRASMVLVPKKACARVPARMPRARRWDRDLRDRRWPKEKLVPREIVPQVIVPQVIVLQVIVRRRDSIEVRDLIIEDREMIVDRDPTAQPLETVDRDLKALGIADRDPKVLELETEVRDLIFEAREMIADRDLIFEAREMIADRDPIFEARKRGPLKVVRLFRRPNPQRRNKQRSRLSSFRRPNPRRPQNRPS